MSNVVGVTPEQLLALARTGKRDALGRLLETFSGYLTILASTKLERKLRSRVSPSDIVQETLLDAHRDFPKFEGRSQGEFLLWLRRILVHNLARQVEVHVLADKRDVRREVSVHALQGTFDHSGDRLVDYLVDSGPSPSSRGQRNEQTARLTRCIGRLPCDYGQVVILRNLEGRAFAEIAASMNRSEGAVRMLWVRALERLRELLEQEDAHGD